MLGRDRKYFVAAGYMDESTIADWVSRNQMKMGRAVINLSDCGRAFELDTQYNSELAMKIDDGLELTNAGRPIGRLSLDRVLSRRFGTACYVVHPRL